MDKSFTKLVCDNIHYYLLMLLVYIVFLPHSVHNTFLIHDKTVKKLIR